MKIDSGIGNSKQAGVTNRFRLMTSSVSVPLQHEASKERQKAFQVWGEADLASGTVTPLILKNSTSDQTATLTYIRWQVIDPSGGTAIPNASNYVQIGYGAEFSSGGASLTPVNMSLGSTVLSGTTCYGSNPTLSGTVTVFDKEYAKAEGEVFKYSKEGSLVIPPGESVVLQYVGDQTSGSVYARFSFFMSPLDALE